MKQERIEAVEVVLEEKQQQPIIRVEVKQCVMCRLERALSSVRAGNWAGCKRPSSLRFENNRGDYKSGFMPAAVKPRPDTRTVRTR